MVHLHCENGCEKVVFVVDGDLLRCVKCNGLAVDVPDCDCLKYLKELENPDEFATECEIDPSV